MMRYDPSKRPTASECLQHPYFQIRLPIPLSVRQDEEESKGKPVEEVMPRANIDNFPQLNPLSRADVADNAVPPKPAQNKIKVTSKELMQNARYKPGVKPFTLRTQHN